MYRFMLVATCFLLFQSCEKIVFERSMESTNPKKNFEYLWNECDQKYSYFELKNLNWLGIKDEYSPKIYDDMSQDSLFSVLADMLRELNDDHVNLISNTNVSSFKVKLTGPDNFDWRIIEDHYLPRNHYRSGPFLHDFLADGSIGYIRFAAFTGTVNATNLDFVLNRYQNTKGLILDLRENGGGAASDIFQILSRFVEQETLTHYSRIKTGASHSDFSEAEPIYISPHEGIRYTNPVAVLTDRGTYSSGSVTCLATKALPNMIMIGDTTGGGLGAPNGGQLPNGWRYRFSVNQNLTLDKSEAYENGVPPDVYSSFNWTDLSTDEILERAIVELQ